MRRALSDGLGPVPHFQFPRGTPECGEDFGAAADGEQEGMWNVLELPLR